MRRHVVLVAAVLAAIGVGASTGHAQVSCKKWGRDKFFRQATPVEVRACLEQGANPNAPKSWGAYPIHWAAARSKHYSVIEMLVHAGADPNQRKKDGLTPLHWAALYSKTPAVVRTLVSVGADPNSLTKNGNTPLHAAFYYRSQAPTEVVQAFLESGADPNLRNNDGDLPLDWVRNKETKRILAEAGATRTPEKSGSGILGAVLAGAVVGTAAASSGASRETTLRAIEAAITGQVPPTDSGTPLEEPQALDPTAIDPESMSEEEIARRLQGQERIRQIQRAERSREDTAKRSAKIQERNARILNSHCSCIRIQESGEYTCLDGFVVSDSAGKPLCDIRR